MNSEIIRENAFYPAAKVSGFVTQELENELLIYNPETHQMLCLNESAALIWQKADGTKSAEDIAAEISVVYKSRIDADFIRLALDNLAERGLMVNVSPAQNFNRR